MQSIRCVKKIIAEDENVPTKQLTYGQLLDGLTRKSLGSGDTEEGEITGAYEMRRKQLKQWFENTHQMKDFSEARHPPRDYWTSATIEHIVDTYGKNGLKDEINKKIAEEETSKAKKKHEDAEKKKQDDAEQASKKRKFERLTEEMANVKKTVSDMKDDQEQEMANVKKTVSDMKDDQEQISDSLDETKLEIKYNGRQIEEALKIAKSSDLKSDKALSKVQRIKAE